MTFAFNRDEGHIILPTEFFTVGTKTVILTSCTIPPDTQNVLFSASVARDTLVTWVYNFQVFDMIFIIRSLMVGWKTRIETTDTMLLLFIRGTLFLRPSIRHIMLKSFFHDLRSVLHNSCVPCVTRHFEHDLTLSGHLEVACPKLKHFKHASLITRISHFFLVESTFHLWHSEVL